jgi:uridine kinase
MPSPSSGDPPAAAAARQVITAAARWRAGHFPLVIAIDGHGAAGKSAIAGLVAAATGAALVHTDDFFTPLLAAAEANDGPAISRYYDWARLRSEALEPLRAGCAASFRPYDWDRGDASAGDGPAGRRTVTARPGSLIVLEGVSSAAPALSDLVHRAVFVDTPPPERLARLRARIRPEEWDDDWLAAEQAYFDLTRPRSSFDLVVSGAGGSVAIGSAGS